MQTALVRLCQSGHDIKFIILLVVLFMLVFQMPDHKSDYLPAQSADP